MPSGWTPVSDSAAKGWTRVQRTPAEVEQVMRQRYPQAYENTNAPQSWGDVAERVTINDILAGPLEGLYNTAKGVLEHPVDSVTHLFTDPVNQAKQAYAAYRRGDIPEAISRGANAVPFIGSIGESADVNRPGKVIGNAALAAVTSTQGGRALMKEAGGAATDTLRDTYSAFKDQITRPGTGTVAAGVGEMATGATAIAHGHESGVIGILDGAKRVRMGLRQRRDFVAPRTSPTAAPVEVMPSIEPPPAPMPEVQPLMELPGPSGQILDIQQPPPNAGAIPAPSAPSILDIKRAEAMQRMNPQAAAPVADAPRFDPRSLPPDPIRQEPWYADAVAAMKARRRGAPEAATPQAMNPAVADEAAVPMIQQMAQERTPNALADVFRNISPEQRAEAIKAVDRNVITSAQDAIREQLKAQGFDAETAELAAQQAKPDFSPTVPARIARARANKAEALFSAAREAGIPTAKMEKLTPDKWEALSIKAGVRKPTWTVNGSETVREVIQMAKEWEAKNGPITAPPRPMKAPSVTPPALNTPEKLAAAEQLRQALATEDAPASVSSFGKLKDSLAKKYNVDISIGPEGDAIELSKIVVPKDARGAGVGSAVMQDLARYADENGKRIVLTPSTDFGASSVSRLKQFYKQFGFVENSGKNKDFSTRRTMYRDPKGATPMNTQ